MEYKFKKENFEEEVVKKEPRVFEFSRIAHSQGRRVSPKMIETPKEVKKQPQWLNGWRFGVLITLAIILIGLLITLIILHF